MEIILPVWILCKYVICSWWGVVVVNRFGSSTIVLSLVLQQTGVFGWGTHL